MSMVDYGIHNGTSITDKSILIVPLLGNKLNNGFDKIDMNGKLILLRYVILLRNLFVIN